MASTTPDSAEVEVEAATESELSVEDIAANLVEEEPRLVLEQDKEVTLRITRSLELATILRNFRATIGHLRIF